jgi:hypothetical protein
VIAQDEAVAQVLASRTVSLDVAAAALTIGRNKAHRLARVRGELLPGVPVYRKGDWDYFVPTPALRRVLQLEGSPLGSTRLTQGGMTEGGPASAALGLRSVQPQLEGSSSGNNGTRSPST